MSDKQQFDIDMQMEWGQIRTPLVQFLTSLLNKLATRSHYIDISMLPTYGRTGLSMAMTIDVCLPGMLSPQCYYWSGFLVLS